MATAMLNPQPAATKMGCSTVGIALKTAQPDSKVKTVHVAAPHAEVPSLASAKHAREAGLKPKQALRNLSPAELYEKALLHEAGTIVTSSGAIATTSGK